MKRLAFIAALALGCDDPEVATLAVSVLAEGSVAAQVTCEGPATCSGITGTSSDNDARVVATRFQDGTHILTFGWFNWYGTEFLRRGAPVTGRSPVQDLGIFVVEVGNGDATLELEGSMACGGSVFKTFDLGTDCTGFGLEAFGVE